MFNTFYYIDFPYFPCDPFFFMVGRSKIQEVNSLPKITQLKSVVLISDLSLPASQSTNHSKCHHVPSKQSALFCVDRKDYNIASALSAHLNFKETKH